MSEYVISLRNIVKKYYIGQPNELEILHNISIDFNYGEFVSIVGESGSGKSTLMNIIGMLDKPTSGEYIFRGENVADYSSARFSQIRSKDISFVFQNNNLIQRNTALKNVELPMMYAGVRRAERRERAEMLLEMVGMQDRCLHRPNELSGGQNQRVAIARAMANDPSIILADEPTGTLDSKTSQTVMEIFHLNEMTVYAPCDGYINSINVLKAQHFSGGAIAEIAVESKNKIIVSVPDEYILKIAEGDNVSYSTSFSDSEFTGVVEDVSAIKNGQGYDVTISSDKADDFLSGMQVSVSFTTENVTDMAVPSTSVLKDEKDEYYILVVKANGNMVEKCNIECGISGNNYTQLLSGTPTIQTGDMVILEPSLYYSGMTVEPVIQEEAEK